MAEDIRGRYKSEGEFVMSRPLADHHDPKAIDESTDTYDTVAWLLENVPGNNGRAGFVGTSYPGFLAMMAGIDPHPAVKAISPQAPMIDVWMGDDFFHNGAFRQTYGYDYVLGMESSKEETEVGYGKDKDGKPRDGFDYFLERGSFAEDVKQSGSKTAAHLEALPRTSGLRHRLVLARRRACAQHGRRAHAHRRRLLRPGRYVRPAGGVRAARAARREARELSRPRALAAWLLVFVCRATWAISTTASPSARSFARRSKPNSSLTISRSEPRLRPRRHGQLSNRLQHLEALRALSAHASRSPPACISRATACSVGAAQPPRPPPATSAIPANPVPYRHRPIQPTYGEGSQWYNWLTEDQRFVTDRKDVAVWKLPVLTKDLSLTGEVVADIFAVHHRHLTTTWSSSSSTSTPTTIPTPRCAATS